MKNTPTCSIIIPVYNAQTFIARTLKSVQQQTFEDWELIVVDDGSQDESKQIVREFVEQDARIRLVTQPNTGVAGARNRGYREANPQTPYLIFLDNDDTWEPKALATMVQALQTDSSAGGATVRSTYIDEEDNPCTSDFISQSHALLNDVVSSRRTILPHGREWRIESRPNDQRIAFGTFAVSNCILSPGAILLRRSLLPIHRTDIGIDPFDSAFEPCDDWHLWLRLTRRSKIVALPEPLFNYRLHTKNASHRLAEMDRAWHHVVESTVRSKENDALQLAIAVEALRFNRRQRISRRMGWAIESARRIDLFNAARNLRHAIRTYRWARWVERVALR